MGFRSIKKNIFFANKQLGGFFCEKSLICPVGGDFEGLVLFVRSIKIIGDVLL